MKIKGGYMAALPFGNRSRQQPVIFVDSVCMNARGVKNAINKQTESNILVKL